MVHETVKHTKTLSSHCWWRSIVVRPPVLPRPVCAGCGRWPGWSGGCR